MKARHALFDRAWSRSVGEPELPPARLQDALVSADALPAG
jgi:hypothetical protein